MKKFFGVLAAVLSFIFLAQSCKKNADLSQDVNAPYELNLPPYFPALPVPDDNPLTVKGVELGRMLFYDPILSKDSAVSCASCHKLSRSFSDGLKFSIGIDKQTGDMNAPAIINPGWQKSFFWNGRAKTLEEQALQPIQNPVEMHETLDNVVAKLKHHPNYPSLFRLAFGVNEMNATLIGKAIAQFERTFISSNSLYDKYIRFGDTVFKTVEQLRGAQLFFSETGDCFHCHGGVFGSNTTTKPFANNGLDEAIDGKGLGGVTKNADDDGKFKVPTLRNVEFTGPYMHDGRFATLEEVINFYSDGLKGSRTLDPIMQKFDRVERGGLKLTAQQKKELLAFLNTFTDSSYISNPAFENPFK